VEHTIVGGGAGARGAAPRATAWRLDIPVCAIEPACAEGCRLSRSVGCRSRRRYSGVLAVQRDVLGVGSQRHIVIFCHECNGLMHFVERAVALSEPQPFDQFTAAVIRVWLSFDIALVTSHPPRDAELRAINTLLRRHAVEQRTLERVGKR
jgi:hypothetical protein